MVGGFLPIGTVVKLGTRPHPSRYRHQMATLRTRNGNTQFQQVWVGSRIAACPTNNNNNNTSESKAMVCFQQTLLSDPSLVCARVRTNMVVSQNSSSFLVVVVVLPQQNGTPSKSLCLSLYPGRLATTTHGCVLE